MKTCKKFLAIMLTVAMVFSMCAFTASAATTEVVVTETNFSGMPNGTKYGASSTAFYTSEAGSNQQTFIMWAPGATAVDDGTRTYIDAVGTIGYNYRYSQNNFANHGWDGSTYDMLHMSYDIKVPVNDTATKRMFFMKFLGHTAANTGERSSLTVKAMDGKITAYSTNDSAEAGYTTYEPFTTVTSTPADIKAGQWQTVDIYVYKNASGAFDAQVNVDGEVIYTGSGDVNIKYMAINDVRFYGDDTTTTGYDNIKIAFDSSENLPSDEEPDPATLITKTTFDTLANGQSYGGGSLYSHATEKGLNKSAFLVTSDGGDITSVHEGGRKYITTAAKRAIYNYNKAQTDFAGYGYGVDGYDALRVSYEINVPADDTATTRDFYIQHNGHITSAYIRSPLAIHTVNGKFGVSSTSGNYNGYTTYNAYTAEYSATADVKPGEWQKVDVYFYRNDADNAIDVTVTVDDTVIYVGNGVENIKYFGLGVFGIFTDGTSPAGYDNIEVSFDKKANVPAIPVNQLPYVELVDINEDNYYHTYGTTTLENHIWVYEISGADLPAASTNSSLRDQTHIRRNQDGTGENYRTDYTVITEGGRTFTKASTLKGAEHLYSSFADGGVDFSKYMRDNDKVTLVYSFDMLIPEGTSSIERRHKAIFQIHTNMGFNLIVKDGFAEFNCTVVNGNDNSIKYPVSEGEWHNFKYVLEVTKGNVVVNSYGICDGVKIYDRAIGRSGMDINTSSYKLVSIEMDSADAGKAYDTYFGGATFAKDNTFSMASVNTSLWDNRKVELVKDASGNVCAYAKNASGFSSGILVMAIYDKASGKLVEIIPSTTIVKGAFEGVVPAAKLSAGMEVKAFVFDAITTVNPLLPNGVLVY